MRIPTISFFSRGLAPSELRVVCGDWDIKQKIETRADQERKVREVTGKFRQEPTTKVKRSYGIQKQKIQSPEKLLILFSISLYALRWPKLNLG